MTSKHRPTTRLVTKKGLERVFVRDFWQNTRVFSQSTHILVIHAGPTPNLISKYREDNPKFRLLAYVGTFLAVIRQFRQLTRREALASKSFHEYSGKSRERVLPHFRLASSIFYTRTSQRVSEFSHSLSCLASSRLVFRQITLHKLRKNAISPGLLESPL